ncbi:hypothetical protein F5Y14DRAFT_410679 [Nemania sp. NC0429]|nr:hypothetical protein F5Y14DRAFT_410679 [Nemania sp. NC0429]
MDKPDGGGGARARHWLDRYGKGYHAWIRDEDGDGDKNEAVFSRPCGLVELRFDTDGRYFGGRADVSSLLTAGVSTRLSDEGLRRHVQLAFALLRLKHCLLGATAELRSPGAVEPWFSVRVPATADAAIRDAGRALRFLDADAVEDAEDFYLHAQNAARVVRPSEALARLFVFPFEEGGGGQGSEGSAPRRRRLRLRFLFVMAHEIVDGMSSMSHMFDFTRILNTSPGKIREAIDAAISPEAIRARLPPAQEDLYPPVAPTRARRRWFWAITIALRRARRPIPAAFPNPLRRDVPLATARPFAPRYPGVLDYSTTRTPPLNTFFMGFRLSPAASRRLFRLCEEAGASVGAGGFVLVGMAMMALHEARYPDEADAARKPFVGGFPLNPRPTVGAAVPPLEGVVLAFSRGVVLPFLPSRLDLEGRFRLLVRQATRQLAAYRARTRTRDRDRDGDRDDPSRRAAAIAHARLDGIGRVLASNYIDGIEHLRSLLPAHLREATISSPLGEQHGARTTWTVRSATCAVSSVGRVDWSPARFDLDAADPGDDGVVASAEGLRSGVRVREHEFLVGTWSEDGVVAGGASFDGNFVDEENARRWVETVKALLEVSGDGEGDGDDTSGVKSRL